LSSIDELQDERNPYDVAFWPTTIEEGRRFDALLTAELGYHGLQQGETISDKRQCLTDVLEVEAVYCLMTQLVSSTNENSTFCAVDDAIPCVMHGRNHIGEKIFMMALLEAWNKCGSNADHMLLIETVENFVNTGVFGTLESKAQRKIPINKENEIEAVSFTAWQVKKRWIGLALL
jgi:hypothetical protein